jgi:hypothetical protein
LHGRRNQRRSSRNEYSRVSSHENVDSIGSIIGYFIADTIIFAIGPVFSIAGFYIVNGNFSVKYAAASSFIFALLSYIFGVYISQLASSLKDRLISRAHVSKILERSDYALDRYSPDSGRLRGKDRPFGRPEQRQIACCVSGRASKPLVDRAAAPKCGASPAPRRTSTIVSLPYLTASPVMPARAVPATGRSAIGYRRTSAATPRLRPAGRSRSGHG